MRTKRGIGAHFVVSAWLSILSLAGCASTPMQVTSIARQDLACPDADLAKIGSDRYAASGCGRGAVYVRLCDAQGCRWGRLRHGHETAIAEQTGGSPAASAPREITPAPAPEEREVLPAPAPAEREILPAPAPDAKASDPGPATPGAAAPAPAAPAAAPAPVPLSQGDLSAPYEAVVPDRPVLQRASYAPPQPLDDDRPPPPAATYQWVNGYWFWGTAGWVWLPGYWSAPVVGYVYRPGYWYWASSYWWYWPGGWCQPGSTTIVVNTAPRTQRVVRVRSFAPRSPGAVSRGLLSPGSGGTGGVVRAAPRGYRPSSSPLLHYPTPRGNVARSSPIGRGGVGRVVRPGATVPRPSRFTSSGAAPSRRNSFSSGSHMGGRGRFSAPSRSAPPSRAPSVGRAQRR